MVYPVTLPLKKHRITFQIMDKDLLSANDYISEASLDFTTDAMKAYEKEIAVTVILLFALNFNRKRLWEATSEMKRNSGSHALTPRSMLTARYTYFF